MEPDQGGKVDDGIETPEFGEKEEDPKKLKASEFLLVSPNGDWPTPNPSSCVEQFSVPS
jgi:hypothetical protein